MPIVRLKPQEKHHFSQGEFKDSMVVLVVGPGPAHYGISIKNPPPPYVWYDNHPTNEQLYKVNGLAVWVVNEGPADIQCYPNRP
jgi:hypothetical protein